MFLTEQDHAIIERRIETEGPRLVTAYILWMFCGCVGAHRFYLGRNREACLQAATLLIGVGVLWALIDGFFISGMVRTEKDRLRKRLADRCVRPSLLAM